MEAASKLVSSSILGLDFKVVIINSKSYVITPPNIKRIAGAGYYLSGMNGDSIKETLLSCSSENLAHALSFLVKGDDSLYEELTAGTFDELVNALTDGYSLIDTTDFLKLSALMRNVAKLIAKPKL